MSPFLKFPSVLNSLLEVFSTGTTGFVDRFYDQLTQALLQWLVGIVSSNVKYADVARISNIAFVVEALDIRGIRPQTVHHKNSKNNKKENENAYDPRFDFEVLCSR